MTLKFLYDNRSAKAGCVCGWGFACLVDEKFLFDTGEKYKSLASNAESMGVALDAVPAIVISHDHWDHTGGLWGLLKRRPGLKVFITPGFSAKFKARALKLKADLREVNQVTPISNTVAVLGPLAGAYKDRPLNEQVLVVRLKAGIGILTGCAHPGIASVVERAKAIWPGDDLAFVIGGFHLADMAHSDLAETMQQFHRLGVKAVGPCHCTGEAATLVIQKEFGRNCLNLGAGTILEL